MKVAFVFLCTKQLLNFKLGFKLLKRGRNEGAKRERVLEVVQQRLYIIARNSIISSQKRYLK